MTNHVRSTLFPRGIARRSLSTPSESFHLQAKHTATHNKHGLSKIIHAIQDGMRGPSHVQVILDEDGPCRCCCRCCWSFPYVGGRPKINIAAMIGDSNKTPFASWVWNATSSSSLPNVGTMVHAVVVWVRQVRTGRAHVELRPALSQESILSWSSFGTNELIALMMVLLLLRTKMVHTDVGRLLLWSLPLQLIPPDWKVTWINHNLDIRNLIHQINFSPHRGPVHKQRQP